MSSCSSYLVRALLTVALALVSAASGQDGPAGRDRLGSSPALDQLKLGFTAMSERSYEAALEHYQTALERATTGELRFQANLGIGSAAAALGRFDEARAALGKALQIKPGNAETLFALGEVAMAEEHWEEAAALFAEAAVNQPGFVEALTRLGVVYEHQGRHEDAAAACWRAVVRRPEDEEALLCFGIARYHLGQYAEASQSFAAVVEKNPGNARAQYSLGLARLYLEDREGAEASLTALEKLDPVLASDLRERLNPKR